MPGAKPAPIASRANEKSTRAKSLQVKPYNRHSPRDGFNGFLRSLPGEPGFVVSVIGAMRLSIVTDLIPASGYQNATTSPSAIMRLRRLRQRRPPHPALNTCDDREAPSLYERGTARKMRLILAAEKGIYFLREGLDKRRKSVALPSCPSPVRQGYRMWSLFIPPPRAKRVRGGWPLRSNGRVGVLFLS